MKQHPLSRRDTVAALLDAMERQVIARAIAMQSTPAPSEQRERARHLRAQDEAAAFAAGVLWATTQTRSAMAGQGVA